MLLLRTEEVLKYFVESLALRKKNQGTEHPCVATNLNNIGIILDYLGRHEEAIVHKIEAREVTKKLFSDEQVATRLNNVGASFLELGNHEQSLSHFSSALDTFRAIYKNKAHFHAILLHWPSWRRRIKMYRGRTSQIFS